MIVPYFLECAMKSKLSSLLLSAASGIITALAAISTAQAATLYTQSLNTALPAFGSNPNQQLADPFTIAAGGTVNQVTWYGANLSSSQTTSFNIAFYANNSGVPGTSLEAISGATPTITSTGLTGCSSACTVSQFTYNLGTSFVASAGTEYFISIWDPITLNTSFVWGGSAANTGSVYWNGTSWASIGLSDNQAFTLSNVSAVPLPATLPLFATGLGALGLLGWRRKRKALAA
jgi:hypothetical protein